MVSDALLVGGVEFDERVEHGIFSSVLVEPLLVHVRHLGERYEPLYLLPADLET